MRPGLASRVGAAGGFSAVALGAFGAHALRPALEHDHMTAIWQTAVFYHFIHAVMLWILGGQRPFRVMAWWSFLAGMLLFSGSLYLMAITGLKWLGVITPFGGGGFLLGWALLCRQPPEV